MATHDPGMEDVIPDDGVMVRHVQKAFKREDGRPMTVLEDISFHIAAGSITCLIGPSGCGKSTLLNIIAGVESADAGIVNRGRSEQPMTLGYVFQTPRLLPWKTVQQNMEFAMEGMQVPREQWADRVDRYLHLVALHDFKLQYPLFLSGGMQQRVGLARAFALEPQLVLMDEPFSSVDELTAVQLREETRKLNTTMRQTTLFVTHNILEAAYMGDRVVVLSARPARVVAVLDNPNATRHDWGDVAQAVFAQEIRDQLQKGVH